MYIFPLTLLKNKKITPFLEKQYLQYNPLRKGTLIKPLKVL
ncbi:hypothetical protein bcere0025_55340 [Bacillus cereus F65185]|nr:hypothetical protein bcere0025_55340 [Bacillus cereus F65185]